MHVTEVNNNLSISVDEQFYTLLGVRPDGVASVVDLIAAPDLPFARDRARALLREHASCHVVELWQDGGLVEQLSRQPLAGGSTPDTAPGPVA